MIDITINNKKTKIETLKPQEFKNLTIVPVVTTPDFNGDLLSLSKGMELGLVKVMECKPATVGTIVVENNAVTPLILINGEEVLGVKQNRIFSGTIIIPPNTTQKVSVFCVEHGRWSYERPSRVENFSGNHFEEVNLEYNDNQISELTSGEFFSKSSNFSNMSLRRKHEEGRKECKNVQQDVWNEVQRLEERSELHSNTASLQDNYKDKSAQINEYFVHFHA